MARATPRPSISYHHLPDCGGNFSFLIDYGGKDTYGCGAENNSYIQRGDVGGFLIDRPGRGEGEPTATGRACRPRPDRRDSVAAVASLSRCRLPNMRTN